MMLVNATKPSCSAKISIVTTSGNDSMNKIFLSSIVAIFLLLSMNTAQATTDSTTTVAGNSYALCNEGENTCLKQLPQEAPHLSKLEVSNECSYKFQQCMNPI